MYFVKTDTPNVYHRVDEMARILFNRNIYSKHAILTHKQVDYKDSVDYANELKKFYPFWNEYIGFTPEDNEYVTINKPISEMIHAARILDIDLCFVDEMPKIPFNGNITVDVELSKIYDYSSSDIYKYKIKWGIFNDKTIVPIDNAYTNIYNRICYAISQYGYTDKNHTQVVEGKMPITPEIEEIMRKDFKENFAINLHVLYDEMDDCDKPNENDECVYDDCDKLDNEDSWCEPSETITYPDINNEDTRNISFIHCEQFRQSYYPNLTNNTPFFNFIPDIPVPNLNIAKPSYLSICIDNKEYHVKFRNTTVKCNKTHPSVIYYECKNIMPYSLSGNDAFDINELLDKLRNPTLRNSMNIEMHMDIDDDVEMYENIDYEFELWEENELQDILMDGDTILYKYEDTDAMNGLDTVYESKYAITDWIIAITSSEADGTILNKFHGTKNEIKALLINMVNNDKSNDEDNFDYGTETFDEIEDDSKTLNAYATYSDYHIDYTAMKMDDITTVEL